MNRKLKSNTYFCRWSNVSPSGLSLLYHSTGRTLLARRSMSLCWEVGFNHKERKEGGSLKHRVNSNLPCHTETSTNFFIGQKEGNDMKYLIWNQWMQSDLCVILGQWPTHRSATTIGNRYQRRRTHRYRLYYFNSTTLFEHCNYKQFTIYIFHYFSIIKLYQTLNRV